LKGLWLCEGLYATVRKGLGNASQRIDLQALTWDATLGNVDLGCDDKNLDVMIDKIVGVECNTEGWFW
jgi:hypothetical protein